MATSLKTQKPAPVSRCPWWLPPAVLAARPCSRASLEARSVPAAEARARGAPPPPPRRPGPPPLPRGARGEAVLEGKPRGRERSCGGGAGAARHALVHGQADPALDLARDRAGE